MGWRQPEEFPEQETPARDILLYFPEAVKDQEYLFPPLEFLAMGATLKEAGYRVHILDGRLKPSDWRYVESREWGFGKDEDWWVENAGRLLFVGITARPGRQLEYGTRFARRIRASHPSIPILWGGWLCSTLPEEMARSPFVDLAVMGEADFRIVEIAKAYSEGRDPRKIDGVAWCDEGGEAHVNEPSCFSENAGDTPRMPYEMVPVEAYLEKGGKLIYNSSRGCSGSCSFCFIGAQDGSEYSSYSAERVAEEMSFLERRYDPGTFWLIDFNFFEDCQRSISIAESLLERGFKTKWSVFARVDQLDGYPDKVLNLLWAAGCQEISLGLESGSQRILDILDKGITVDQIREVVSRLNNAKINVYGNFILGTPGETLRELYRTLDFVDWMSNNSAGNRFAFYPFTPVWGTKAGAAALQDDKKWATDPLGMFCRNVQEHSMPPMHWIAGRQRRITRSLAACYLHHAYDSEISWSPSLLIHPGKLKDYLEKRFFAFRVRKRFFALPLDWWLIRARAKIVEIAMDIDSLLRELAWRRISGAGGGRKVRISFKDRILTILVSGLNRKPVEPEKGSKRPRP